MEFWLPVFFAAVMGLALLLYVVLDGYDLGVGLLMPFANDSDKDLMIASIGPFWDANETWIVLGVGILLITFPEAHGVILTKLYIPATLMVMGLVLRGIAFDFRVKACDQQKARWTTVFSLGSLVASMCQGWMLGAYVTGLTNSAINTVFAILTALTLPALYIMLGAAWLMCKTNPPLPELARSWARYAWLPMGIALLLISIATPIASPAIADKWFSLPDFYWLLPIPLVALFSYGWLGMVLLGRLSFRPLSVFLALALICLLSAVGLGYSIFPDIIPGQMGIFESAADTSSLLFTFWGVLVVLPMILGYTVFVYRIFRGTTFSHSYE
jgi:cytochrome d ubiquinol oxidase subunit II